MAQPAGRSTPKRRLRGNAAVFAGSFLAHAWVLGLVATMPGRPDPAPPPAGPIAPVALAPHFLPPRQPQAARKRPKRVAPAHAAVAARQVEVATADPAALGAGDALDAPLAALPPPSGDSAATGAQPPPDLTSAAPAAGRYPINPGYWQVSEHWLLLSRVERYCVEPWNITRFMAAPCNHIYHCDYPVQRIENNRFHFAGVVWRKDERYNVTGGGAYSPTSLHLSATGAGHFRFLPVLFSGSLDGQFLGPDCPLDAKRLRQAEAGGKG